MKTRIILITLGLSLAFLIIDVAFGLKTSLETLKIYMSIYIVYLASEFAHNFQNMRKDFLTADKYTTQYITNPLKGISVNCIEHVTEESFYRKFHAILEDDITRAVRISYMHSRPPRRLDNTEEKLYYDSLLGIVKSKSKVTFIRMIRYTDNNKEWIKQILNDFSGLKNFNLAVLRGYEKENYNPPISVQCIDDKYTFLVAIATQRQVTGMRDLIVRDSEFTTKFAQYYENIFKTADHLMRDGKNTSSGNSLFEDS